jgi:ABC-type branched-subunit amino acid transport system ATPase component
MIRRLELKNFKRFRLETFEFLPNGITFIAGGNNSGKSSILHALALWEYCRRMMEAKHGRVALEDGGVGHVFRTPLKNFTPLIVPDFRHLWTNLSPATDGTPTPMELKVTWLDRAAADAVRELAFTLDLGTSLRVKASASTVPSGGAIPRTAFLPPFAGIQVKEKKLDAAARERLLGQGLPGAVLRNHLRDLERRSQDAYERLRDLRGQVRRADRATFLATDPWKQFVAVLNEEFKCVVYPAEGRSSSDGHIYLKANLSKGTFLKGKFTRFPKYKRRDVVAEGSGFLQWLSVFALAANPDVDVLLLDEADVHLHPTLQAQMLYRLNREAVRKAKQVLYVTHSTEILRNSDYRSIYYVAEKSKGYLGEESGKVKVIEGLGSLYLPRFEKLRRTRRLLLVEGTSDLELLKIWAATLRIVWPEQLVEWISSGKPSERKTLFQELNKEVAGIHAISLRDRDEDPPATTAADLRDGNNPDPPVGSGQTHRLMHRKWRRRHIENYLVLPAAIARAAIAKGNPCSEQEVIDFLRDAYSAVVNNTFAATDCHQTIADLRAKELTYEKANNTEARFGVNRFDIAKAMTTDEVCADVKTLLGQIVALCGRPEAGTLP